MSKQVKIAANGRVSIPADVRTRLGLKDGDTLTFEETEDGLVFRTVEQRIRRAQAIFQEMTKDKPDFTVDDFIRERRAMWGEADDRSDDAA